MVIIDTAEPGYIAGVNIMQMDTASAFAHFCIGGGPFAGLFQISLKALVAIVIGDIEVDHDMIFRDFNIMEPAGIQLGEFGGDLFPFLRRRFLRGCILGETVRTHLVKNGLRSVELEKRLLMLRLRRSLVFKLFRPKTAVITPDPGPVFQIEPFAVIPKVILQFLLECPLTEGIGDLRLFVVGLIHLPCRLQ